MASPRTEPAVPVVFISSTAEDLGAYRKAAGTIRTLERPLRDIIASDGIHGLMQPEGVGKSIAHTVEQMVRTGKTTLLDRLRARARDFAILTTVPGLGLKLAPAPAGRPLALSWTAPLNVLLGATVTV